MADQINELNKNRHYAVIGILAAVLMGAGGCRAVNDTVEKDDADIQACSQSLTDGNLTSGELLKEAMVQLEAGHNEKAIDLMYYFLDELTLCSPPLIGVYQDVRFKLASLLMSENRMDEAAHILQDYIDSPLAGRESEALEMLNACASEIGGKG